MIQLKEINKKFKDKELFHNLSYDFKEGNIYHIKGYNGVGKSVLLKIISGFSLPNSGSVVIGDKTLGDKIDFIYDAGVSINNDEFISYLTGYDNLKLLLDIQKKSTVDVIDKYAKIFNLEADVKKKPYRVYSQGMKQKLRLIQAFMEEPKYLILDEPTNALDKQSVSVLYNLIEDFVSSGDKIVIFVTHSDDSIASLANVVLEIDEGSLKEVA